MLVLVVLVLLGEVPNPFEAKVPPLEKEMCQTTETDKTKRNIFRGGCLRGLQDEGKEQLAQLCTFWVLVLALIV